MPTSNALQVLQQSKALFAGIVTSLQFYDEKILIVGHGPFLKIYNVHTGKLLLSETALPANRIHRIVPVTTQQTAGSKTYLIYGSKTLREVHIHEAAEDDVSLSLGPAMQFSDWIMDATRLETGELALAFAHNQVEVYKMESSQAVLVHRVQCQVRCILYSARFYGKTRENLVLGAGTVFNEVHVWKVFETDEHHDGVVAHRLVGHEGVIFGVRFNEDGTMLASVSDDRTIRVWPLTDDRQPLVIFGHTARIWDCQFVDQYIISISEDATCRVWRNILMDDSDRDEADCLACWEGHTGKNVWSCAVSPEKKMIATGGQDSGVRLWSLVSIRNNNIESEDDLTHIALPSSSSESNYIRNFCLVDTRTTIIFTSDSYFFKVQDGQWTKLYHDEDFQKYAIMECSPCGRFLVAGNMNGQLMIVSTEQRFQPVKFSVHKQKVFEIFIKPSRDQSVCYIVSTGYDESMLFHRVTFDKDDTLTVETQFALERPVVKTTPMSFDYVEEHRMLLVGSRESALVIYEIPSDQQIDRLQSVKPLMQLRRSHGKQAVSNITAKQGQQNSEIIFWTTGRDGCIVQYRLVRREQEQSSNMEVDDDETPIGIATQGDNTVTSRNWTLEKMYRNRVTKGWLEDALLIDNELLLLGFYRKRFFVYNESKGYEMISIACGGAHRRWQFKTLDAKLNLATFVFVRKERLYAYFRDGVAINDGFVGSVLQENFHGRDVRALRFLDSLFANGEQSKPMIFATGGEDTILRINQYISTPAPSFVTLASIRKHRSVIKSIVASKGIDNLIFTSGGNQELWCWKLELLPSSNQDTSTVSVNCLEWAACPTVSEVIETRIMDITVHAIDAKKGLHLVGAGYSDSTIRIWLFNESTRRFSLIADGSWHTRCILQTAHLVIPGVNGGQDRILFFTTATDGRIAVWDISNQLYEAIEDVAALEAEPMRTATNFTDPVYFYQAHQSGVNGLDVTLQHDTITIFTGGEDNAVAIARLKVDEAGHITPLEKPLIIADAHASSVTGVSLIRNNTAALSISTDQRLNMWSLDVDTDESVQMRMVDAAFVDVPDPSTIDTTEYQAHTHAAIAGIGMESFIF